jgi:hypothetical protein
LPNPNDPIAHKDDNANNLDNLVEDIPDDLSDEDYTTESEEDIVPLNITNRGLRELRNLQTYYNPDPLQYIDDNSINVATKLENILIIPDTNTTPHEMVYGSPPDWIDNLHKFGELAIVHDGAHSIKSKLQDKGLLCLFVGYPENHAGEVCQFFNLATKRIILSRSAILLHKTYADFHKLAKDQISYD